MINHLFIYYNKYLLFNAMIINKNNRYKNIKKT